ncbi:putative leucine-rich repeat receptor-like protein kinase [Platanthera zijinensis]|uniref:non-specific serine/threonine protein kinase n=1 Tax=Platanthera zijinensis TaxID=2320716 RepID=A0AAP0B585_9ASPA
MILMITTALLFLLAAFSGVNAAAGVVAGNQQDTAALRALMDSMKNTPPGWGKSNDPCGPQTWEGITCSNSSRVEVIKLYNMGLRGTLTADIGSLSELRILDLSYNKDFGGPLTPAIGNLGQLEFLILVGCSFSGPIPSELGKLTKLILLALNSNQFVGNIPASLGALSHLRWLELADNQLTGPLPVSNGSSPGLDQLKNTQHFHLNKNKFSGLIPEKLFSTDMRIKHLLLDRNQLIGTIPASIGYVQTIQVIRLDRNLLEGAVPPSISNLTNLHVLNLANNGFTGPMPNLTGMNTLNNVDLSNNSFDPSEAPEWISELENLTSLTIQSGGLRGQVPEKLFSFPLLQKVILKNNSFSGELNMGSSISQQLVIVNFENNALTSVAISSSYNNSILLSGNPVCNNINLLGTSYCLPLQQSTPANSSGISKCDLKSCATNNTCSHPYKGTLLFRAPFFQDLGNNAVLRLLESSLWQKFNQTLRSVSLQNPFFDNDTYLEMELILCPGNGNYFNIKDILEDLDMSTNNYSAPAIFGPSYFEAYPYILPGTSYLNIGLIVGLVIASVLLLLGLSGASFYAFQQKKRAKKAIELNDPFATWEESVIDSGQAPQLRGARYFSYEELKTFTNNFPEINVIGSGGYGKVYRGMLPDGRMVAIKRSNAGSTQGGLEFKTEIELLSRVHHKNLVDLVGFCFQQGEGMLVYEYVPNGTLRQGLSGESGIQLDWTRRLRIALDSARGLAYLHEFANPPIIHRDIKSSNILLDANLNAKVADFGLSKLVSEDLSQISTQVKGTLGYLDPEYYMTQILTEKSDVYSFGVVMLELITGDPPIHNGKYMVSIVKSELKKNDVYYGLKKVMDPVIRKSTYLVGFRRIVELALQCVEDLAADRPAMSDVVKEIEMMLKNEGLDVEMTHISTTAVDLKVRASPLSPYDNIMQQKDGSGGSFSYSGSYTWPIKVEPK